MEYKLDKQLLWISELFKKNNIRWILDSGSLLSIIREGEFFKEDDMDIGILKEDTKKMLDLKDIFEKEGFIFAPRVKANGVSSIAIWAKKGSNFKIPIDLKFFEKEADLRWSPSVYSKNAVNHGIIYLINLMIKTPFYFIHKLFPVESKGYDIWRRFFDSFFSGLGYWSMPANFIENTINLEKTKIRIPKEYEKYLEFRYGKNWRTPVKKWNYTRDDGGMVLKNPFKTKIQLRNKID